MNNTHKVKNFLTSLPDLKINVANDSIVRNVLQIDTLENKTLVHKREERPNKNFRKDFLINKAENAIQPQDDK